MPGTNNFVVFDPNLTNTETDAQFAADTSVTSGLQPGAANPLMHNKLYHQVSIMAAAIGDLIAATGNDASDVDKLALTQALTAAIIATIPLATDTVAGLESAADKAKLDGVATGATNTSMATAAPPAVAATGAVGGTGKAADGGHTHSGVTSFNGRNGAVTPGSNDYTPAMVGAAPAAGPFPWGDLSGVPSLVNSFAGRSGAVTPGSGDYTAAQVTNAAATNAANDFLDLQTLTGGMSRPGLQFSTLGSSYTGSTAAITSSGFGVSITAQTTRMHVHGVGLLYEESGTNPPSLLVYQNATGIPAAGSGVGTDALRYSCQAYANTGTTNWNQLSIPFDLLVTGLTVGATYYYYVALGSSATGVLQGGGNATTIFAESV